MIEIPLLFIDTESDPKTKEPLCIQTGYTNHYETIKNFKHPERLSSLWNGCEAVIFYNAPYDMGVISSVYGNTFVWDGTFWRMNIFENNYKVRRINGHRNIVRAFKHADGKRKSVPVIDLLKLWSILVDESDISLKQLIRREFGKESIPYTAENALTREYQLQDVIYLEKLWYRFLEKVSNIEAVKGYTYEDWAKITTPATFTKMAYAERYPDLTVWKKHNDSLDKSNKLENALEQAYHGGITISFYRGTVPGCGWYDIHGAYAHVIEYENTDQYMIYEWEQGTYDIVRDNFPVLCQVKTNVVFETIQKSLKIYGLETPKVTWMWSYDILALRLMFGAEISVLRQFRPIPLNTVGRSLSAQWSDLKEIEQKEHGKTTLRNYYKFLSNTSYGIKAQRVPYKTKHTNMVIAGIITARAHLILAEMIHAARLRGGSWLYSDTDSICISGITCSHAVMQDEINAAIAPYSAECEHIGTTRFLSLKRYLATGGTDTEGRPVPDKIRLHGKSVYRISEADMMRMLSGGATHKALTIGGISANTERTLSRVMKINPFITHKHPFMFETNIKTSLSENDWFRGWISHIDTKTTCPLRVPVSAEFARELKIFPSNYHAVKFYRGSAVEENIIDAAYRDYDREDEIMAKVL